MFATLRNRFGIPGVISVIALVFALVGGAFAANDLGGSGKSATASAKKAAKGPRGPKGATGATGPAGAAGPAGSAGAKGDAGGNGADGPKGATGPTGKAGEEGPEGPEGPPGEPWTPEGTLPSGATLTGTYLMTSDTGSGVFVGYMVGTVSFSLPLEAGIPEGNVIYVGDPNNPPPSFSSCEDVDHPGTASVENPEADPGFLCIYQGPAANVKPPFALEVANLSGGPGTSTTGAILYQEPAEADNEEEEKEEVPDDADEAYSSGSWAVTAPF